MAPKKKRVQCNELGNRRVDGGLGSITNWWPSTRQTDLFTKRQSLLLLANHQLDGLNVNGKLWQITCSATYARSTFDENSSRGFTDDELAEMIRSGQRIELHYGHLFDDVIVNGDLSTAFEQLLVVARKIDTQSQWVPVSWVVWRPSFFFFLSF